MYLLALILCILEVRSAYSAKVALNLALHQNPHGSFKNLMMADPHPKPIKFKSLREGSTDLLEELWIISEMFT